jgi:hypothetical protein
MAFCEHCGRDLGEHARDVGFALPDEVWRMSPEARARRVIATPDLCTLDGARFFLRGVASVPIATTGESFGFGLWAEVTRPVFDRYRDLYRVDASDEPSAVGSIANELPHYPPLRGHPVEIRFGDVNDRPRLVLHRSFHPLSVEQSSSISTARMHRILETTAVGWSQEECWDFDQVRNVLAITSVDVIQSQAPVLLVIHYADDHSWAFLSGLISGTENLRVVCMESAVACDPTLHEVADLPPGWVAMRSAVGAAWERHPDPDI